MSKTQSPEVQIVTIEMYNELLARVEALEVQTKRPDPKEMTDEMALRVINGDLKDKSHKDAATALGLTYGQIYSARLEFTFKNVHKQLKGTEGYKNKWVK